MRKFLSRILKKPVLWLSNRFSSKPDRHRIFDALSALLADIISGKKEKGLVVPFDITTGKFIIFSDQHKGGRNGADDFVLCEPNYLSALDYYHQNGFHFISLGDGEELWENTLGKVCKEHHASFKKEKLFVPRNAFTKIFGNHDLYWGNDPLASFRLKDLYEYDVTAYEGVLLQTTVKEKQINIFCTHGHQGDKQSDGNWFSKWFVSNIWAPLQMYLKINPNTPAYNDHLKSVHNTLMYEWSMQQKNTLLITGHTHQPVFESLTHIERLYRQLLFAEQQSDKEMIEALQKEIVIRKFEYNNVSEEYLKLRPSYYNSGCCCFTDGAITGIEIQDGTIRLIEWKTIKSVPERKILEETPLDEIMQELEKL
jgi:predicted phosphodiesterase